MSITPSQLGLKDSPRFKSEGKRRNVWVMEWKTLQQKGIKIPNEKIMVLTPTK